MKKTLSIIGVLIIIYMLLLILNTNVNVGIYLGLFIGASLVIIPHLPNNIFFNIIKVVFVICVCFFIFMSGFIAISSKTNTADFNEDALIVLGCGLHGSNLSKNLKDRLDTAIDYYNNNPSALIIVSGGQGPQEDITEAEAMKDYLLKNNIPENNIIMEDKSTSTNENFKFSKKILDEKLDYDYTVSYITNDFHIYRAGKLAKLNNLNAKGYGAPTEFYSIFPNYLRESLAVIQLWIFGR
ncbi:MAG: YdcF family protein [Lachnospirales bacterium]